MTEVADKLAWSQSTISRIETGLRPASAEEVSALLAVYQVTGARRDALIGLARDADRPSWLETGDAGLACQRKTLALYELDATRIVASCVASLPVLLQTPSYARASLVAADVPAGEIEARLESRRERQKVLDRKNPPKFVAYLDEGALHRQVGGSHVMANQLRHLVALARRPAVDLRVVPFTAGGHPSTHVLLEFGDDRPVVYLDQRRCGVFLHRPGDVDPYLQSTVDAKALDPARSVRLIESLIPPVP